MVFPASSQSSHFNSSAGNREIVRRLFQTDDQRTVALIPRIQAMESRVIHFVRIVEFEYRGFTS